MWTLLKRLASLSSVPWVCFGDFNEILWPCEKVGGNDWKVSMMKNFQDAIRDCNLMDLGSKDQSNKRYGHCLIEERLDHFLGNKEWSNMFLETATKTLETWTLDHNSIQILW